MPDRALGKVADMAVTIHVNGDERQVLGDGRQTLLDALRDDLGVTGPKLGCGEGACGACTVLVGNRPVQARQVQIADVAGQRITTVEGLAEDEIAAAVGADPVEFRLRHLDDERLRTVLETAAAEIGWPGDGEPPGSGTGIALGFEKGGRVATAARVEIGGDGSVRLARLVTVADCGTVVHPDGLVNQIEGALAMGLGPALFEQIDFAAGLIRNASMSDYRVPRLADVPADIKVVLIDRPDQPLAGGGEAPIVAVAPAIANAIDRACGVRLRSMPLIPAARLPRSI